MDVKFKPWQIIYLCGLLQLFHGKTQAQDWNETTTDTPQEAPDPASCACTVGATTTDGHPDVHTFDAAKLQLFTDNKFVVSRSTSPIHGDNPCKFQMRVTTDADGRALSWLGIGYGIHKNQNKFRNNIILGVTDSNMPLILLRGQDFSGAQPVAVGPGNDFIEEVGDPVTRVEVATSDGVTYVLTGTAPGTSTCQYRVTFTYGLATSSDMFVVQVTPDYEGHMEGLCGGCDGDTANDFEDSSGNLQPDTPEGRRLVSDLWIEGLHQNPG